MHRWIWGLVLGLSALIVPTACGDDAAADGKRPVDVAATCDRLEDLATAYLDARDVGSIEEFADAVGEAKDAFVDEAGTSGDGRLADLAETYDEAASTYLTGEGIDAREAGNDADIALDRAAARCIELGADNDFPEEP